MMGLFSRTNYRNLIIFSHPDQQQTISVRAYTVDSAIENETNFIRVPQDALTTMQMDIGDTIELGDTTYSVNETRPGEAMLRIPSDAEDI